MQLEVNRGSVCMGDDAEDHRRWYEVEPQWTWRQALAVAFADGWRLAYVHGGAAWAARIKVPGPTYRDTKYHDLAFVRAPDYGVLDITPMNRYWLDAKVGDIPDASLDFEYFSNGQTMPVTAFTSAFDPRQGTQPSR